MLNRYQVRQKTRALGLYARDKGGYVKWREDRYGLQISILTQLRGK